MKISKIITVERDICITDVTLLTKEEAETLPKEIRNIDKWWWLRSPSHSQFGAALMASYGAPYYDYVNSSGVGVRPALKIESTNLTKGDKFEMAGQKWTVINEDTALCDDIVGKAHFRKDWKAPDANDYEASDIKKWLAEWARERGIEFNLSKEKENFIPLSVLEDIRAEIKRNISDTGDIGEADGYYKALNIIDRHIKGEEDADSD